MLQFRFLSRFVVAFLSLALLMCFDSFSMAQETVTGVESRPDTAKPSEKLFKIKVSAGKLNRKNKIVDAPIWYEGMGATQVVLSDENGDEIPGVVCSPYFNDFSKWEAKFSGDLEAMKKMPARLIFELPELPAGASITLTARKSPHSKSKFKWDDDKSKQAELLHDGKPVVKYMYEAVDDSTPQRRAETYKVFHHVYSPAGDRLLTKGAGGLFPHHRGIFFGFNKISYLDKRADIWHCKNGESQVSNSALPRVTPFCGRMLSTIRWNGQDGRPFAIEQREVLTYKVGGATMIDFHTELTAIFGPLQLAGDPQHAGVQFRASQEVPDLTKQMTYYIRPDGKAKPGEFRNWSNKKDETEINKSHINLPWLAMSIALPTNSDRPDEFKRYTICYLDSDSNPKPARFSERDYGRFGSYFETTIDIKKPLLLHYRFWIVEGEMEVEQIQNLSDQFANPVEVEQLVEPNTK